MRDIDDMLPQTLVFVPSCPEPLAIHYIREAARTMCHNVRLWRAWDEFEVHEPNSEGMMTIPDADIVEIQSAQIDGRMLVPVTVGWLDGFRPGWDQLGDDDMQTANYITQLGPNTISVYPAQSGLLKLRVVLQPSLTALTLPDNLVGLHGVTLGRGAASLALMHPTGDFANPSLGAAMYAAFMDTLSSVKIEFTKGQQGARLRTTGAYF